MLVSKYTYIVSSTSTDFFITLQLLLLIQKLKVTYIRQFLCQQNKKTFQSQVCYNLDNKFEALQNSKPASSLEQLY